jgi:O-antigen/teichoic acid export membrane protein
MSESHASPMGTEDVTASIGRFEPRTEIGSGDGHGHAEHTFRRVTAGTARMATAAGVRQILSTALLAITAATVARCLGPTNFGLYAGGTAAFYLVGSVTDLGFSLVLVREMASRPADEGRLMGAAIQSQFLWSLGLTAVLLTLGVLAGGPRGAVMVALSPAIALSGLGVSRQIFSVRFRATPLLVLDLSTTILQALVMIGLAVAHAGIVALAGTITVFSFITGLASFFMARRVVVFEAPAKADVVRFFRMALPLGFASLLATLYFTIDQTLLGWLVPPRELGHYAAAVKIMTVVVTIPGFMMAAGIPGLARSAADRVQLSRFAGTLAHWIVVTALPLGIGIAVFAKPVVLLLFGHQYLAAVPLIRILMLAAVLSFASNVLGIVLMTLSIVRPQILFNTLSLIVNVVGNILLVPRYGVAMSAWLTVVSEAIVVSYGLVVLRRRLSYPGIGTKILGPAGAVVVAGLVGIALGEASVFAMGGFVAAFVACLSLVRGWPDVGRAPKRSVAG